MTRKRFIRLVMAYGIQRNEAQSIAWAANRRFRSYAEAYAAMHTGLVFRRMGARFAEASVRLRDAASKAAYQFRKLVDGMNAFRGGLQNEDPCD